METKEKPNKEMTYEEKKQEYLKELYGNDYAERTRKALISENTRATLYVRGMVKDLQCALFHSTLCYTVIMMMKQDRNSWKHLNQLKTS